MKAAAKRFVLDASVAVAWCFDDEVSEVSEAALNLLHAGAELIAPAVWPLEIANALLVAERRKRISLAQVSALIDRIGSLPVSLETTDTARAFGPIFSLARERSLTEYDAAYLELALRRTLPLATLDDQLRRAAHDVGIALV